jgi:hypothetical protein
MVFPRLLFLSHEQFMQSDKHASVIAIKNTKHKKLELRRLWLRHSNPAPYSPYTSLPTLVHLKLEQSISLT